MRGRVASRLRGVVGSLVALAVALAAPGSAALAAGDITVTLTAVCDTTLTALLTVRNDTSAAVTVTRFEPTGADVVDPDLLGTVVGAGDVVTSRLLRRTDGTVSVEFAIGVGATTVYGGERSVTCPPMAEPTTTELPTQPAPTSLPAIDTRPPATLPPVTRPPTTAAGSAGGPTSTGVPDQGRPVDADVRYQPAIAMVVGQPVSVGAQIVVRGVAPVAPLVTVGPDATTAVRSIVAGCTVDGWLEGPGFDISPTDALTVSLCDGRTEGNWVWTVTPREAGARPLTLRLRYGNGFVEPFVQRIEVTVAAGAGTSAPAASPGGSSDGGGARAVVGIVLLALAAAGAFAARRIVRRRAPRPAAPAARPATVGGRPLVFVSYSRRDADQVGEIEAHLEAAGYEVWRDTDDIVGGEAWRRAITDGVSRAVAVVLALSSSSAGSINVAREIALADESGKPIIPVVLRGDLTLTGSLKYILAETQLIDLRQQSFDAAMAQVCTALAACVDRAGAGPGGPAVERAAPAADPAAGPSARPSAGSSMGAAATVGAPAALPSPPHPGAPLPPPG